MKWHPEDAHRWAVAREGLTHPRTRWYTPKGTPYLTLPAERPNQVHQVDDIGLCYLRGPVCFWGLNTVDVATARGATSRQTISEGRGSQGPHECSSGCSPWGGTTLDSRSSV